jgi:hypothetical protein
MALDDRLSGLYFAQFSREKPDHAISFPPISMSQDDRLGPDSAFFSGHERIIHDWEGKDPHCGNTGKLTLDLPSGTILAPGAWYPSPGHAFCELV